MNRRREIVRRAAEIFLQKGVAQTSMEDIAQAVGIKREGLYYYFQSRNDILLEIILPQSDSLLLNLQRIIKSRMTAMEKLHAAIQSHLHAFYPAYLEMSVALREHYFVRDATKLHQLKRVWDDYSTLWTDLIKEGQANGEFKADLDPKMVAFAYLGMCNWFCRWYNPEKELSIDTIIATYFSLAATGVTALPAAAQ